MSSHSVYFTVKMKFLAIALFSLLYVNSSFGKALDRKKVKLGKELILRPLDLTYKHKEVWLKPYKNLTDEDMRNSEITYDNLNRVWAENVPNVDPIEVENITLKISCGDMQDVLHLKFAVITELRNTKWLPVTYRGSYNLMSQRLDINVTIPQVVLYSYYEEEALKANGTFIMTLKDVSAWIVVQVSPIFLKKDSDKKSRLPYEVAAVEAHVKAPGVTFQLGTNPNDDSINNNTPLVQMGVDIVMSSARPALGDYLRKVLEKYINKILPSH